MRKGLVYREIFLNKKKYITGIVIYFSLIFVGVLIRMSMNFGNLAKIDEEIFKILDKYICYIFTMITPAVLVLSLMGRHNITASDYKTGWQKFSHTFPISAVENSLYITAMSVCGFIIALVLSMINLFMFFAICGQKVNTFVVKAVILITCSFGMMIVFEDILVYIFKKVTTAQIVAGIFVVSADVIVTLLLAKSMKDYMKKVGHTAEEINEDINLVNDMTNYIISVAKKTFDICVAVMPLIMVVAFVVFYLFVRRVFRRREK
ncbi:MAG: hypothetical protein K2J08_11070 [Ruminococcus sp.]|nr:hypothetical protein [Ruminococcus sp.]